MLAASDQVVKVQEAAGQRSSEQHEKHKPSSRRSSCVGIERIEGFKNGIKRRMSEAEVWPLAQVLAQDVVDGFGGDCIAHRLNPQLDGSR